MFSLSAPRLPQTRCFCPHFLLQAKAGAKLAQEHNEVCARWRVASVTAVTDFRLIFRAFGLCLKKFDGLVVDWRSLAPTVRRFLGARHSFDSID
jgi:hypothetical protein